MQLQSQRDAFLEPACTPETIDRFCIRASILNALQDALPLFHGTVLDIGSGLMPYRALLLSPPSSVDRYIGMDLPGNRHRAPDIEWDGQIIPLADAYVDCALATEVVEHVPDLMTLFVATLRVLKEGGLFFFTTPFLWPLHEVPFDEWRLTPWSIERQLSNAGFTDIHLRPYGGWHRSLAQMLGLWVRRSPMSDTKRALLSSLCVPAVRFLISRDEMPQVFDESLMIPGLSGTARKPAATGRA